jgi:glutamate carboxypeptidase
MWGTVLLSLIVSSTDIPKLPAREKLQKFCIEEVGKLAAIKSPSGSREGLDAIALVLKEKFETLGFDVEWNFDARSFTATSRTKNPRKTILLVNHIDTVFEVSHRFADVKLITDPSILQRVGLYGPVLSGPGVSDAKGGIVLLESLIRLFQGSNLSDQIQWKVFLAADEETSSRASRESLHAYAAGADLALVFEAGWYDLETQTPSFPKHMGGNFHVGIKIEGPEQHSAMSYNQSRNTNDVLFQIGSEFESLRKHKTIWPNVNHAKGESKTNVTTPLSTLRASIRYANESDEKTIEEFIERIKNKFNFPDFTVSYETKYSWHPQVITSERASFILTEAAKAAGQKIPTPGVAITRGAGAFLTARGIDALDDMGPYGEGFHGENEILFIGSFYERLELLKHIVLKLLEPLP